MDTELFLRNLHQLSLEEGYAYIQEHIAELSDHAAIGKLLEGEALRLLYTPFVSLKLAELLIFFGAYVQHSPSHALGLKARGDALMVVRHLQSAMSSLDAAGEEFLRLGDEGNWARSRISWIVSAAWSGRVEEALQQAARARETFLRLGEPYWACVIDHNTAMILDNIGQYREALDLYASIRLAYAALGNHDDSSISRSIALAELNSAFEMISLGYFGEAENLLQQTRTNFMALGETHLIINTEIELANLNYIQGYYGSALRRYYSAVDSLVQNQLDDPVLLAELQGCIANCLVKLNRAQEACPLASEAVEIYKKCGILLSTGNALREYASTLVASGRQKEALMVLDEAWTHLDSGGFHPYAFVTLYQQAEILLQTGSFTVAYEKAARAREYFEAKGLVAHSVRASLVMATALIERAKLADENREMEQYTPLEQVIVLCKDIISQARQYHLQEEVYKSYYLLGQIYALQGNLAKTARYYGAAIAQIERILDDLVYDLSSSFLQSAWAVYEDMIALWLEQGRIERAFVYLEQARSMALRQYLNRLRTPSDSSSGREDGASKSTLQQESAPTLRAQRELRDEQDQHRYYSVLLAEMDASPFPSVDRDVIEQELKRCEEKMSELHERLHLYQSDAHLISEKGKRKGGRVKPMDMMQIRQRLSTNQTLLAYFLYKGRLVIFASTRERLVTKEISSGVEQLERLLPLLHAHLDPRGWSDRQNPAEKTVRRLLNKLYALLVAPVAELLPPAGGLLTIVPYGPLHKLPFHALYDGSRYLVGSFQVNYLPASSLLMHLEMRERVDSVSDVTAQPPLVFGFSGNGHLQRVRDEATTVASLLDGQCYLENEATISRLISQATGAPIIHLATHGMSRLDAPNFSFLHLADGQLNAIDAFSLDLKACELVTLSGCETGLALSGGGDEQLGLGRAFLAAGATSLVMSLWPVEDNATTELMKLFYRYLLQGESKAQALCSAQRQLLQDTSFGHTHPFFWAAFRLVGDVSPVKFRSTTNTPFAEKIEPLKK